MLGGGWVLSARDFSSDFPDRAMPSPHADAWVNLGHSVVIAPGGNIVAGRMRSRKSKRPASGRIPQGRCATQRQARPAP